MKKLNKAFTLTELLVGLGVIAILCAILIPVIVNILPNQNVLMAKRAYYTIKSVVSELINNEACYPDRTTASEDERVGFDDGYGYPDCDKWGGRSEQETLEKEGDRVVKFTRLFFDQLGANGLSGCAKASKSSTEGESGSSSEGEEKEELATTSTPDGITWFCSSSDDFKPSSGEDGYLQLHIDVNGNEEPNCSDTEFGAVTKCGSATNYDQFSVKIYSDGKIELQDKWVKDAVKITKDITE
ncbi:MAG: type II secretion system GspH family protein [Muribaculaceae bacterium]|nr:type II secretion system GspH family protein [Muribaculaceae bacterium]